MKKLKTENVMCVDENDVDVQIVSRAQAHKVGLLHRISVVYLTDEEGKILVQERMSGRLDHSAAGHVDLGEDYLIAAKRELKEELGVVCELNEIGKAISKEIEPGDSHDRICHIFKTFECKCNPRVLSKDEVKSVFWADPLIIYNEMQNDKGNQKYCGGFKVSLKLFLEYKKLL